jgi:8-oxo-dGTP diphosphatase
MTGHDDTPELVRLTADVVAFAAHDDEWRVLMIQRRWAPFEGMWAFPGGHVDPGETFGHAAARELAEETGLVAPALVQLAIYDQPDRDPRGRYVNVAYIAVFDALVEPIAGDDARHAEWVPLDWLLRNPDQVAFDHAAILLDAVLVELDTAEEAGN